MNDFEDRVAVVAGGAGSLGRLLCQSLLDRGARVASLDLLGDGPGLAIGVNLAHEAEVDEAIKEVESQIGAIELLLYAAATPVTESPISDMPLEQWAEMLSSSLTGAFLTMRRVTPSVVTAEDGRIVALSSGYGRKGYRNGGHYAAAKGGLEALVKSLALELADRNVTVNAVAPGPIAGPRIDHLKREPKRYERTLERIPMGRLAAPEDVVAVVMFLLSRASAYVTGQVIHVNGGMLMP